MRQFLLIGFILISFQSFSQVDLPKIISPSPNAATLGKYGDIPVSQYTGSADFSVPLYTIQSGDVTIPISLSYHTGGIRLSELAGWTGLGWALNAGGVITRSMMDKDDFDHFSSNSDFPSLITKGQMIKAFNIVGDWERSKLANNQYIGIGGGPWSDSLQTTKNEYFDFSNIRETPDAYDTELDIFSFNFQNKSGKFVFTRDGTIIHEQKDDLKIEFNGTTRNFKITDDKGFIYYFEATELASLDPFVGTYITSWYLSRIESPKGQIVTFTYVTTSLPTLQQRVQSTSLGGFGGGSSTDNLRGSTFSKVRVLSQINFDQGYVQFTNDSARLDYISKRITGVKAFLNGASQPVTQFDFVYSYFGSNGRLRLDQVVQKSGTLSLPPYAFTYNNSVPGWGQTDPTSYSIDHWGYYNGVTNSTLLPELIALELVNYGYINVPPQDWSWVTMTSYPYYKFSGANRNTGKESVPLFSLKEIKYPTGGKTTIETEAHTYEYDNVEVQRDIPTPQLIEKDTILYFTTRGDTYGSFSSFIDLTKAYNIDAVISFICTDPNNGCAFFRNSITYPYGSIYFTLNGNARDIAGDFVSCGGPQCSAELTVPLYSPTASYQAHIASNVGSEFFKISVHLYWTEQIFQQQSNKSKYLYAGGLRVKKISNYDVTGNMVSSRQYDYHYIADSNSDGIMETHSYGRRMGIPRYWGYSVVDFVDNGFSRPNYCPVFNRYSSTVIPLSSSVGYDQVTETIVDNTGSSTLGKSIYYFENKQDSLYQYNVTPPEFYINVNYLRPMGIPNLTYKLNGSLLHKVDYKTVGTGYQIVNEIQNEYTSTILNNYFSVKHESHPSNGGTLAFLYIVPSQRAVRIQLTKTTEKKYDQLDPNKFTTIQTNYTYGNNHEQAIQVTKTTSEAKTEIQKMVYSTDYGAAVPTAYGIKNLKAKHIIVPVEQYSVVDGNVVAGSVTTFKDLLPYPDQVYVLETPSPIATGSFNHSNKDTSTFALDAHYVPRLQYYQYDVKGNVERVSKSNDANMAYIWGYNSIYPIAEVKNVASTTGYNDIGCTSFESTTNEGNWSFAGTTTLNPVTAKSGKYYYTVTTSTTIGKAIATGKYRLEYYAKAPLSIGGTGITVVDVLTTTADANGWILYKKDVTISISTTLTLGVSSGSIDIDELRLYPSNAMMTSYTYDPLIGLTTMTDPNMMMTYYEYDEFNRLKFIKNENKKVLKSYQYHYKDQR